MGRRVVGSFVRILVWSALAALTSQALAQFSGNNLPEQTFRIGVDRDNDPTTGCDFTLVDGTTVSGVEIIVVATVNGLPGNLPPNCPPSLADDPRVASIRLLRCDGSVFVDNGARDACWPVGLNNGVIASDVVEASLPLGLLGVTEEVRLVIDSQSTLGGEDTLTEAVTGGPIVFTFPVPIPTMTQWGLILFILLLTVLALWWMRRTRRLGRGGLVGLVLLVSLAAIAQFGAFMNDGDVSDWAGVDPLATDPVGDAMGDETPDLTAFFAGQGPEDLFFRLDVVNLEGSPPTADPQTVATDEDTPLTINLTGSDPDGDALTFSVASGPANGSLGPIMSTGPTSATVDYTPNADFNGPDSFDFLVDDSFGGIATATVSITVNPINDDPVANAQTTTVTEDIPETITLTGSDVDGDALTFTIITPPTNGALGPVTGAGPTSATVDYTPNLNYNGPDSFVFQVDDGSGGLATATVDITVTAVNDPPTADPQSVSTDEDTPLMITLTGSDKAGDTLTFTIASPPGNGSLGPITSTGPFSATVDYTPNADYNGPDSFDFQVDDGNDLTEATATATVSITVNPINDPPTAVADSLTLDEGGTATTLDGGAASVLANDSDTENDNLTVTTTPVSGASNGALTLNADGTFSYTHDGGETTADSFTYEVCDDGAPVECATAVVTITINPINDPPMAMDDAIMMAEGDTATMLTGGAASVLANDTDAENDNLTVNTTPVTAPNFGALTLNADGTFSYTHDGSQNFNDSFVYEVCDDGSPSQCDTATVTITVTNTNDAPMPAADSFTVAEAGTATTLDGGSATVLNNDTDPDADNLAVNTTPVSGPSNGALTLNADGTFSYTHNGSETTSDSFTYEVCDDGSPVLCANATVTITITPVNDPPTAVADAITVAEDGVATTLASGQASVLANDSDAENDTLTVTTTPVSGPTFGSLTLNADGTFSYDHDGTENFADSFTYEVCDNGAPSQCANAVVTITITPVNDPPVVNADAITVLEDGVATTLTSGQASVLANDSDPEGPLTVTTTPVSGPTFGSLTLNADGTFSYDHDGTENFADSFTYEACDNGAPALCANAVVTITITPVNDPPTAVADAISVLEDGVATTLTSGQASVLANDSDAENDTLTVTTTPVSGPTFGSLTLNADGTFSYDHDGTENFVDSFTYEVCDNGAPSQCANATVTITITPVNDPPVANADSISVNEGATATTLDGGAASVLANDTDPESGILTVNTTPVVDVSNGTLTLNADGTFSYTHNGGASSADSFTYEVCDNGAPSLCDTATVSITITPIPDDVAYDAIGNTELVVGGATPLHLVSIAAADGVLVNDPTLTVTSIAATATAMGGTIDFDDSGDGSFSYVPPVGFTGTDTFDYTVNGGLMATITFTVVETVWFVRNQIDANNPAGGDGRISDPFDTLGGAETASAAGDTIYVFEGDGTTTGHDAGIALKANQRLIGEGVALSLNVGHNGNPAPTTLRVAGSHPLLDNVNAGGHGIEVVDADGVEIRGLNISGTGNAIRLATTAAGDMGVTVADCIISGSGLEGVLSDHTGGGVMTTTMTDNTMTASTGNGFQFQTGAAAGELHIDFNRNTRLMSGANAVNIDGSAGGTAIVTGFADNTVHEDTVGTGVNVNTAFFDSDAMLPAGDPLETVNAGTTQIGGLDAAADGVGGAGMVLTSVTGDLSFTDLDIVADGGAGLEAAGTGPFVAATGGFRITVPAGSAIDATGGAALDLDPLTAAVTLDSASSATSSGNGIRLVDVQGTVAINGGVINNPTANGALVSASSATVTLTDVTISNAANTGVNLNGNSGTFQMNNGGVSGTGVAVNVDGVSAAVGFNTVNISKTGGLLLSASNTTAAGDVTFTGGTFENTAGDGVSMTSCAGDVTIPSATVTGATTTGVALSGNSGVFNLSGGSVGVANNAAAAALSIQGSSGNVTINGVAFAKNDNGRIIDIGGTTGPTGGTIQVIGGSATQNGTDLGSGAGTGVLIQNCAANVTIAGANISNSGTTGVDVQGGSGTFNFTGTTVINGFATAGVNLNGGSAPVTFNVLNLTGTAGTALAGLNSTGLLTVTSGAFNHSGLRFAAFDNMDGGADLDGITVSSTNHEGVDVRNSAATFDFPDLTISTAPSVDAILLSNNTGGTINFGLLNLTTNGTRGLAALNSGNVNVANAASSINTSNATALEVNPTTVGMTFASVTSTNSGSTGISLSGLSGTLDINGGSISGATGTAFNVSGGNGVISYDGSITNSSGRAVSITGKTGGSVTLAGAVGDTGGTGVLVQNNSAGSPSIDFQGAVDITNSTGTAVSVSTNTGATVGFADLDITNTTSNQNGLFATGAGTLNVTTGVINTGSGRGVDIDNTALAATFRSVSSSGGNNPGIDLDTTTGSFTVNGDGVNTTRGGNNSGGTIASKGGGNSTATGIGVRLISATNVTLRRMLIQNCNNWAVYGSSVNGFVMEYTRINGTNGNDAGPDEGSVFFTNLTGTAAAGANPTAINSCDIEGGLEDNVRVNNSSGTLTRLMIGNTRIGLNSNALGNDGVVLEASGSATANITVDNCDFIGARGDMFQVNPIGASVVDVVFTDNTCNNTHGNIVSGGGGITIGGGGGGVTSTLTYNVDGNTITGAVGIGLNVFKGSGSGTATGVINDNDIGVAAVANSGSSQASALNVSSIGAGSHQATITNNRVRQYNEHGIRISADDGSSDLRAVVQGNTISNPNAFALYGLFVQSGSAAGDTTELCLTAGGAGALQNSMVGSGPIADFRIRQRNTGATNVIGYAGGATNNGALVTYVQSQNTGTPSGTADNAGIGFNGACTF